MRKVRNVGDEDAVYVVVGGKDGYVGRDGRLPEGEESPRGAGFPVRPEPARRFRATGVRRTAVHASR